MMNKYTIKDIHKYIGNHFYNTGSHIWILANAIALNFLTKNSIHFTRAGSIQMVVVSNGTAGLTASFQIPMEKLMENISNVIVCIDDLLIHSQNHEQNLASLDLVMQRPEENNLKINMSKWFLGNTEVSYLRFRLTPLGIKPGKDKLRADQTAKIPHTKEEIKSFMGLCNLFRTQIKDFAIIC
jgi:hypothetical protein